MAVYINENNEYYNGRSIIYNDLLIINPTPEILLEAGYHEITPPEPLEEDLLEMAILSKLQEINNYDLSNAVNIFYLGETPMWLDAQTRQILRISIESYQATGAQNVTKWFNGQEFTFPVNTWMQMLNALEVYAAEALNVTEAHKVAVQNLETILEVEDYDITQGYPQKLNLTPQWLAQHA